MSIVVPIKNSKLYQMIIGIGLIIMLVLPCFFLVGIIGNKVVALILLLAVSILAMLFDILPVMITAVFSALVWNFFFIPPLYEFAIGTPEDILLFLMYFAIALLNAVLTSKIRKSELRSKEEEEREKTIKLYNTVLNSLSHELRTPISTIIGAVDTMKDSVSKLSPQDELELLSEINIASLRLNRHVENLLNMSRLESGFIKAKLDWCDINEMVYKLVQGFEGDLRGHSIRFNYNETIPLFKLDRGLMEQVLHNLIYNAIQYTPPETEILIEVKKKDNNCMLIVSDQGAGFPVSKMTKVFEKFYRLPQSVVGGTGLGLSIVKGFVEAHGGQVVLSNKPTGGAVFTIIIPAESSDIKFSDDE